MPSRSRISQGPPAPGRSPGGRSMGREGKRPHVLPLFPDRFRPPRLALLSSREIYASLPVTATGNALAQVLPTPAGAQPAKGLGKVELAFSSLSPLFFKFLDERTHICFPRLQNYKLSIPFKPFSNYPLHPVYISPFFRPLPSVIQLHPPLNWHWQKPPMIQILRDLNTRKTPALTGLLMH